MYQSGESRLSTQEEGLPHAIHSSVSDHLFVAGSSFYRGNLLVAEVTATGLMEELEIIL